mgnify:CR=1 FL=1
MRLVGSFSTRQLSNLQFHVLHRSLMCVTFISIGPRRMSVAISTLDALLCPRPTGVDTRLSSQIHATVVHTRQSQHIRAHPLDSSPAVAPSKTLRPSHDHSSWVTASTAGSTAQTCPLAGAQRVLSTPWSGGRCTTTALTSRTVSVRWQACPLIAPGQSGH